VGVAAGEDLSDEDVKEQLQEEPEGTIAANVAGILGGR